jgi:putative transposase
MARPLRIDYPGAFYHVTCRGNERKNIFRDDRDREVFLEKLQGSLDIYSVRLHAYVLMENHFHFICQTPKANLSSFMRQFNISYTGFYNRRHNRVGHLYQGRFKAIVVEADNYLLELSRYSHLNPVRVGGLQRAGMAERVRYLKGYRWSSLGGYLDAGKKQSWIVYEDVLEYVGGSRKRYGEFIEEGLRRGYATPWEELEGQVVLGGEGFWERLKGKWEKRGVNTKEQPSLRSLERIELQEILRKGAKYFQIGANELTGKRTGHRDKRAMVMECMYRHGGVSQAEIGRYMGGMDYTAVSHERRRIRRKISESRTIGRWAKELEATVIS